MRVILRAQGMPDLAMNLPDAIVAAGRVRIPVARQAIPAWQPADELDTPSTDWWDFRKTNVQAGWLSPRGVSVLPVWQRV